uniref:Uncharacterized protein n=1 Tax=Rhipicephalus zambeziensis TaxID=60191 RepID=A0A224Z2B2_9ACAR
MKSGRHKKMAALCSNFKLCLPCSTARFDSAVHSSVCFPQDVSHQAPRVVHDPFRLRKLDGNKFNHSSSAHLCMKIAATETRAVLQTAVFFLLLIECYRA